MVVGNLNVEGVSILPAEADAVLVVDPDTVLPLSVAFQCLKLVSGDRGQVAQRRCPVQVEQLSDRNLFDGPKPLRVLLLEDLPGFGVSKGADHVFIVYRVSIKGKRKIGVPIPPALLDLLLRAKKMTGRGTTAAAVKAKLEG